MATFYWVGGSGNWNDPLNWSEVSGGFANTDLIPTDSDDVIFDENSGSGAYTVNITGSNLRVRDITVNETATIYPQFALNSRLLIYGDMVFTASSPQTAVTSGSSDWYFISNSANQGTKTINTKGVDLRRVTLDASGFTTTFSLASALTVSFSSGYLRLVNNSTTFTTNNHSLNIFNFDNDSGSVTVNLGSSNVTISGRIFFLVTTTTINAGTSTIIFTSNTSTLWLYGSQTLHNVVFEARTGDVQFIGGSTSFTTTFNNLTINGPATAREYVFAFNDSNIVINGVFTIATGVTGASRVNVWTTTSIITDGRTTGQRTITVNGSTSITDATFSNINFQGTAAPVSGTRIGDLGNNTNLNASSPKTVYRSAAGSLTWNDDVWSNSSGGTPSRIYYPLPQDTAIIDDNSGSGVSNTAGVDVFPSINGLSRTTSYSFTFNTSIRFVGDMLTGPNVGLLGGNSLHFTNKTSSIIDINAVAATGGQHWNLFLATTTATLRLVADLDLGLSGDLLIYDGDIITNGYNLTAEVFNETGGIAAADVNIENSSLFLRQFFMSGATTTLSSANSYIEIRSSNGILSVNENRASQVVFNDVTFTSDSDVSLWKTIRGRNLAFNTLTVEPPTSDSVLEIRIDNNNNPATIEVENLYIGGSANNAIRRVALTRAQAGGDGRVYSVPSTDSFTLRVNTDYNLEDVDFLNVKVSALGLSPLVGTRLGDLGGNENITFDAPKNVYWVGSGAGILFHSNNWALTSGGAASQENFPLPQDTAIFDDALASVGDSIILTQNLYFPDADFSARTQALTITPGSSRDINVMGDFNLSDAVTNSSSSSGRYFIFSGTNTVQNVRTRNLPFHNVSINGANTEVVLLDDLNISLYTGASSWANRIVISNGAFSPGSNDVNIGSIATSASINSNWESNEAVLNFGSGTWSLSANSTSSGAAAILFSNADFNRITINPDTATIKLTGGSTSSSGTPIFTRGADLPKIEFAANNWWRFYTEGNYGTTTFADFTNSSLTPKIVFDSADGDAFFDAFNINGGGINSQAQIYGSENNNWTYNGSGFVSVDAVFVNGTSVFPRNNWIAGVNSTDAGSNVGWIFLQRPDPTYFVDGDFEESTFEKRYVKYDEARLKPFTDTSGILYGWGSNGSGGLISGAVGDGFSSNNGSESRSSPVEVLGNYDWKCVFGTGASTFGIQNDGSLWSWGANFQGALGTNELSTCYSSPVPVCGGNTWYSVSGSGNTAAAIDANYKMWTWGWNSGGALGINTTGVTNRTTPGRICDGDSDWRAVTSGRENHFGIKTDGTLWSWGRNGYGVLGHGGSCVLSYSSPIQEATSSSNWCHICVNKDHVAAAIKEDGSLWTWGCAFAGALGHNLSTSCHRSSPGEISGGGNFWCTVAMGFSHGAAIKTNGTLWSWGQNDQGQLALQTLTNTSVCYSSPVQEAGEEIQWNKVEASIRSTAAIKTDGTLWSWGDGFLGILGNNCNIDYSSPVQEITSSTSWKQISRGGNVIHGIQYD